MEWGYAKKFIILLLLVLNCVLFFLNIQQNQENVTTAQQEKAIFEVLSKNGITMYTDLPEDEMPMKRLLCHLPTYGKEELEKTFFFGEKTTVVPSEKMTIYRNDLAELTVSATGGHIRYHQITPQSGTLTREDAVHQGKEYIKQLSSLFAHMELFGAFETEWGYRLEFFERFADKPVFSNCVVVDITQDGIWQTWFSHYPVDAENGEEKEIFLADEALLTFLREQKKQGMMETIAITRMELGYDIVMQNDSYATATIYAVPCYRIYTLEDAAPFVINAYTGQKAEQIQPFYQKQSAENNHTAPMNTHTIS